jgi:CNT family concentrative nucleoside transporter
LSPAKCSCWLLIALLGISIAPASALSQTDETSGTAETQAAESNPGDAAGDTPAESDAESQSLGELKSQSGTVWDRAISFLGLIFMLAIAWLLSTRRWEVDWKLVGWGVGLQIVLGVLIFYAPVIQQAFDIAGDAVTKLLQFSDAGSEFIFDFGNPTDGAWAESHKNFAFSVLPTIIFFSSLMTILYYTGIMQTVVRAFAVAMRKTMDISGAESLSASANIFVGQTEAPLVVKPYVEKMTRSELAVVMTGGFATVAGGVLAIYVGMLDEKFPDIAKHLLTASVMSAPAALVIAKILYPETEEPVTKGDVHVEYEADDANVIDAASRGASEGLTLALNVGAMLLAFLALIAMINYVLSLPSLWWNQGVYTTLSDWYAAQNLPLPDGCTAEAISGNVGPLTACASEMAATAGSPDVFVMPAITLQWLFGYAFWPFAWAMGVPVDDCFAIAQLLGEKMVINEFVAYASLSEMLNTGANLSRRSVIIATYALCGFANFGSIGIQLGGIGGIAPSRKSDLAQIALRAMIGGTLAAMMTATIAGILV